MTLWLYLLNYIMNEMLTCFHRKMTGCIFSDDAICENVWQNQNLTVIFKIQWESVLFTCHNQQHLSKSDGHKHLIFIFSSWWFDKYLNHLQNLLVTTNSVMDSSESQKLTTLQPTTLITPNAIEADGCLHTS